MYIDSNEFSKREKDVVRLLLRGKSNKQIALELGISNRTVEFHLSNIYAKLGVNSRSEAILKCAENQLRESTGDVQVKSTVDDPGDSAENGFKPTLRRIPVKKLYIIIGGLSAIILIAVIAILKLSAQNLASKPATSIEQATGTSIGVTLSATVPTQTSTEVFPTALQTSQPTSVVIPSHTVNGYTATIESYYVDTSHIIFQVRITGEGIIFGNEHFYDRIGSPDLYDENGNLINTSGGWGPAIDPALYQFEFIPTTRLEGDRIKGQFAFDINNAPQYDQILAKFRFDFDLPIYREMRFYPKQVITANGVEMLLDSVTVTPTFTQVYLCFVPPSFNPWTIGNQTILQIGEQEASLYDSSELFSSATGSYWGTRSEPNWIPPMKNGSCFKIGFQGGNSNPTSLTLTIPDLENLIPYLQDENPLYQLPTVYPGLSEKQAYHKYLEENGYTYKGPWKFTVDLTQ